VADNTPNTTRLKEWVARIEAGDAAARDELLRAVADRLKRLARKMLRSFPNVRRFVETDDVFNSSLRRLVHALENHVHPESMRSFYGLAAAQIRRELLDLARRFRGPRAGVVSLENLRQVDSDSGAQEAWQPEAPKDKNLERWCVFHEAVEELPVDQREVIGLIIYHGWTRADVAVLFQVSPRTVRRWYSDAILTLRKKWKRDDI
jgi:RNA polymerase sigma-70 factor (ECF subfamily)